MPNTTPASCTTILLALALTALGCADRQAEPDYSEIIYDACEASCPITTGCGPNPLYDTVEECVQMCPTSEVWDDLNECDTRNLELAFCTGGLTCAEYEDYLAWVESGSLDLPQDYPCVDELEALYACDSDKPFEEPQR